MRKVRIARTSRGFGCRGGLGGRLLHICMEHANRFPNFFSFLPASVLHPGFCGFILYTRKEFQCFRCLQSSRILGMSSENSTMSPVARGAGLLADGCKRILDVRNTSGKRWLRFFNGKRILRDMLSEEFKEWDVDQFAEALVLRSLRAVPGVWRLPVWEQAEDINFECFSCLGSWSFRTRIPQRTHTQLYGTMCGILESIHQVRAPPAQWAELEVPLRAAVCDGDVLLADDREANKAWCVDRQELFLYLTSQLFARQAHLDIPARPSGKRRLRTSLHQVYFGSS